MNIRLFLMTTTSMVGLFVLAANSANAGGLPSSMISDAEVIPPDRFSDRFCGKRHFEFKGGLLQTDNVWKPIVGSTSPYDKLGFNTDTVGGFVEGKFSCFYSDNQDIAVGLSHHFTEYSESDLDSALTDDVSYQNLDIEHGWTFGSGNIRLHAGARILRYESDSTATSTIPNRNAVMSSEFTGLGPRVGVEFTSPVSTRRLHVFGELAAAVLVGHASHDVTGSIVPATSSSGTETVINLEAELGIGYSISDRANIQIGASIEQLNDIDMISGGGTSLGDRTFEGVFIGFETDF